MRMLVRSFPPVGIVAATLPVALRFPTFSGTMTSYDCLPSIPNPFGLPWFPVPLQDTFFAPARVYPTLYRPASLQVNHAYLCQGRRQTLPGSWGTPLIACPGLGTPAAPDDLALTLARVLPSARLIASASATTKDFGADSSRPATPLCTPHPKSHPSRCNTRYRPARYSFGRAGFPPAGSHRKVSSSHVRIPLSQAFAWRDSLDSHGAPSP
jgi:hypothetical protein